MKVAHHIVRWISWDASYIPENIRKSNASPCCLCRKNDQFSFPKLVAQNQEIVAQPHHVRIYIGDGPCTPNDAFDLFESSKSVSSITGALF